MALKLETLFNQKAFDRVFIRQLDDVTCTPASLTTIARLYDLPRELDFAFFKGELKTGFNGTFQTELRPVARKFLPVTKSGIDVYDGGVALATIRHKPTGYNHSVVFLAKKGSEVVYYDPCDHKIYHDNIRNMQRGSQGLASERWTANMPKISGASFSFWKKLSVPNPYPLKQQVFWLKEHGYKNFPPRQT